MSWDDGAHAKVKKVQITYDEVIYSIQVTYDGSNLQSQLRGSIGPKSAEFTLASDEYITSLNAYGKTLGSQEAITFLAFTTNKRVYGPYGNKSDFQLSAPEATGKQIAGFLGSSSNILNSIDVHYAPKPTGTGGSTGGTGGTGGTGSGTTPKKLKAEGGEGTVWDDGSHDNVKKVYIGQDTTGVAAVKFEYKNGSQVVLGVDRGKPSGLGYDEFELGSEEYITSVEGTYEKIYGSASAIMTMLLFKTSKNTTRGPYGIEGNTARFVLKEEGYKIVGFHGRAGENINAIGVYLGPIGTIPISPAPPGRA